MGFAPPPKPLTQKEFNQAISEGKKHLWEIDPKFWKWLGHSGKQKYIKKVWKNNV